MKLYNLYLIVLTLFLTSCGSGSGTDSSCGDLTEYSDTDN